MRYIAIIPAAGLVVAFAIVLIGSPFSSDTANDSAARTPPVSSVTERPADLVARLTALVDETDDLPPADIARVSAEEADHEEFETTSTGDAVAGSPPGEATDAAPASQPIGEEVRPAETCETEEDCQPCVPRNRRQGRRFNRCR
jgi:hypothetical protein